MRPQAVPRCLDEEGRARRREGWGLATALAVVAIGVWIRFGPGLIQTLNAPRQVASWHGYDLDTGLIIDGLKSVRSWGGTLAWWIGTWAGQVPFYRPLTSYVFWAEWHMFGEDERWYSIPTLAAHLAATLAFTFLIYRLVTRRDARSSAAACLGAVVGGLLFTGLLLPGERGGVARVAEMWKNQPDALAACFAFLSLAWYRMAVDGDRRRAPVAVAFYLIGCGFKESIVPLPLLFPLLELDRNDGNWAQRMRGHALSRLLPVFIALVLFLVVRTMALRSVGYLYGSNGSWLFRTAAHLLGPHSSLLDSGWPPNAAALWCGAVALVTWRWPPLRRWWAVGALLISGTALIGLAGGLTNGTLRPSEALTATGWLTGILILFQGVGPGVMAVAMLHLAAAAVVFRRSPCLAVFCLAWVGLFLAPIALSPSPSHRYYLPDAGHSLLIALGAAGAIAGFRRRAVPEPIAEAV